MAEITPELTQGAHQSGQTAQNEIGFVLPFIEWMAPYRDNGSGVRVTGFEGNLDYDITPIDDGFAKVRLTDVSAISVILAEISVAVPTTIPRIDFPDVLTAIVTTVNSSNGLGSDSHPAANQSYIIFGSGSGGVDPTSSSQGSASIIPDIQPEITQSYCQNVPAMEYTFYAPSGTSQAEILTILSALAGNAVLAWPQFKPVSHTITCKGMQVSVSAKADTHVHGGGDTMSGQEGHQWGNGSSVEVSVSVKTVRISPTIHGAITIAAPSPSSENAAASADASTPIIFPGTPVEEAAITNTVDIDKDATASVSPSSLSATTPYSAIPSAGLFIYSLNPGPLAYGEVIFQAVVVDFATL